MAYSRSIRKDLKLVSDGVDSERTPSFLEWHLSASTVTCEPIYGFLPCSTNVWGLLFLIVVYEILLSLGGQYVANGSNLFFQIIGPGVFGASLFQFLGTVPQIVLVLVSALSGSTAAAQQRAKLGMGLVAGTTVMLLTLIWGSVVVLGSYDLSQANTTDSSGNQKKTTIRGYGVVTDVETSYTARIILITLFPLLILQLATIFHSSSVKRVIILIVLIITVVLLAAYIFYQTFQPWIQNRRFEYLMSKYAKDKLMRLISRNGKPDTRKIQELFNKINKNNDASISTAELRVLLLGVHMDDDDSSTDRNVENIMASLDTSADGRINQDEFIKGMTKLVSDISNQTPVSNSQIYGGVYMNNVIGLIVFLAPVYARNLAADASAEVLVVLIICIVMSIFTSFCTTFPRWTGYLVLVLYPTSLASVYILTSVFGGHKRA
ncbi:Sodium/calcium exchanger NCL2 [Sesamum angolense]|uniref:Sodium/calcium exchanger NCL2 n=1 Tax=Sesamum angolense TaxID=2727404 RepID=A0AAE2BIF5_9LAMI|nr:Sodium/calcium exchanger NCL2 [Sesamum angolense]